jgi:hypothetical protein
MALRSRTTRDQHQHNDHGAWSPPPGPAHGRPSRRPPAQDASAGTWEHLLLLVLPSQPAGTLTLESAPMVGQAASAAPQPAHGLRRPRSAVDPGVSHARPTRDHPLLRQARFGQRRPNRSQTTATRPTQCAQEGLLRRSDALGDPARVRTAQMHRPWTPNVCPSGHPPDLWTDVRTADRGRGQGNEQRGRRPDTLDGRLGGQTSLRLQHLRRSATHDGSAVTTPPTRPPPQRLSSCSAPLGMKPRLGALLS